VKKGIPEPEFVEYTRRSFSGLDSYSGEGPTYKIMD